MELTNDFRVRLPVEQAWAVLTDIERIAPCMPGAQLQEVEGETYRGVVKVKVGPITAQYKGQATFVEQDEAGRVAVLRAEGRETRGQGNANATITARLTADGDGTAVSLSTDLTVTGKVAQFGRGVLADVSAKLLDQFVECLERTVADGAGAAAAGATTGEVPAPTDAPLTPTDAPVEPDAGADAAPDATPAPAPVVEAPSAAPAPAVRRIDSPEAAPVDLVDAAGASVAKRVTPVLALVAVAWLLKKLLGRRH
jgi:carbon monoxide dehydrogenase subunit G